MAVSTIDAILDVEEKLETLRDSPEIDDGQKLLLNEALRKISQVNDELLTAHEQSRR